MTDNLPTSIDDLPASLRDMAETFGFEVTWRFMQEFGGTELRLPEEPKADHPVLQVFGEDLGKQICFYHARIDIYVPRGAEIDRIRRSQQKRDTALKMAQEGHELNEIAKVLEVSRRQIRNYLGGTQLPAPVDPNQLTLPFDD